MGDVPWVNEMADGRVHVQHGPIDMVITIDAPENIQERSLVAVERAVTGMLNSLVADLNSLRSPARLGLPVSSTTAARMIAATSPLAEFAFITPMAAVAGSVADTVCEAAWIEGVNRIVVNNGGDIAIKLVDDASVKVALADVLTGDLRGGVEIRSRDGVGGIATSGRHGRSLTMGIADSVTVFACDTAAADAAATIIASAVDLPNVEGISRCPARDIDANSDLGDLPVVVGVCPLNHREERKALDRGLILAGELRARGLIIAAALRLGDSEVVLGANRTGLSTFLDMSRPVGMSNFSELDSPMAGEWTATPTHRLIPAACPNTRWSHRMGRF